tara:strand:- start:304 stop:522 length:219 start_codon:yes stop_codon:yes gene_type:complete
MSNETDNAFNNPYNGIQPTTQNEFIALAVIDNLVGRKGIGDELEKVELDIRMEIITDLNRVVGEAIADWDGD